MRVAVTVQGDMNQANIMQLEYDVEDIRGVSRANFDPREFKLIVEYDEFLTTPAEIVRAIQQTGKFTVRGFS